MANKDMLEILKGLGLWALVIVAAILMLALCTSQPPG